MKEYNVLCFLAQEVQFRSFSHKRREQQKPGYLASATAETLDWLVGAG